jgi:hypothetical protein
MIVCLVPISLCDIWRIECNGSEHGRVRRKGLIGLSSPAWYQMLAFIYVGKRVALYSSCGAIMN